MDIKEFEASYTDYVINLRREFHRIPELSFQEFKTSARILQELETIGITDVRTVGTGIIATIHGGAASRQDRKRPCIALRADIDALAVTEQTGLPYASEHEGFMHVCGHDCHIAILLCAAKMITYLRDTLSCDVRLIFEPAEEISQGALTMIEAGALDGVDSILGLHVWSDLPAGKLSIEEGPRMASSDYFTIDIDGKSCHGAQPHQGIDAVVTGAAVVTALQTLVSREINPQEPAVLTIGKFTAGVQSNVVAGHAQLCGTARTFSAEVHDRYREIIERIVRATCQAYRADVTIDYKSGHPPLVNKKEATALAAASAIKILGPDCLVHMEKTAAGEDFSEYIERVPGCFAFLGIRNDAIGANHPQHSCYYQIDETALIKGALLQVQYVLDQMS